MSIPKPSRFCATSSMRLRTKARDAAHLPSQVRRFVEDFLERYARAREAQADKYFQEIVEIADAATPETVNVARLRVDSRKFTVARLAPKKYGDQRAGCYPSTWL